MPGGVGVRVLGAVLGRGVVGVGGGGEGRAGGDRDRGHGGREQAAETTVGTELAEVVVGHGATFVAAPWEPPARTLGAS